MTDYRIQSNRRRVEAVDLQPYGNTISVETISDNPFEDAQDVEVFTQANDGFGGPAPASMRSKRIITKPAAVSPMWAGRVSAVKMRAPAHKTHTGFAPGINGLGETPGGAISMGPSQPAQPGFLAQAPGLLSSLATTAGQLYSTQQATQQQRAQAAIADAQARAADAEARRAAMMAPVTAMQQHSGISGTMLAIGGIAAVAALFMFLRKKK